jgi:transketolase
MTIHNADARWTPNDRTAELRSIAGLLRKDVLQMVHTAGSGHCGGCLSSAEVIAVLYFAVLRVDPGNPNWPDRDRFIASKGHCAPLIYAALARRGFFPPEELQGLRSIGHFLQGHPDMKTVPGVDMSTGSLGLGLSVGVGMSLGARLSGRSYRTYVLLGDGELQEGQVWEAAMAAARYQLANLTAVVDRNGVQLDGRVDDIMPLGDLADKWRAFGWNAVEVDGHDPVDLIRALGIASACNETPSVVIANTVKGKGVSFMEGNHEWHGKPLGTDDLKNALAELGARS